MSKYKKWTMEEMEFIKQNHQKFNDKILALKFNEIFNTNVTSAMIRRQRRKLFIKNKRGRPKNDSSLSQDIQNNSF